MESSEKQYKYDVVASSEEQAKVLRELNVRISDCNQPETNDNLHTRTSRTFLYIATCTGNLATFSGGIVYGWTSPIIPKLQKLEDNPLGQVISKHHIGWIGSLSPLGGVIGPCIAGLASDRIGRKKTLLLGNIPLIIGLLLNIFATNVYYLFVSRFMCGISVGLTFTILPMYIAEIAEDEIRGTLGTLLQLYYTLGLLFSYILGPYLTVKMFNIICIIFPVTFFIAFFMFIPESPYYLLQANRELEAEVSLLKFRFGVSPNVVRKELDLIKTSVTNALATKGTFLDIFKSKGLTKGFVLANGLLIFQQLSGINVVIFFAQNIFQDAGVALAPEICTIIVGIVQVISSASASILIDSKGNKFLLMFSAAGMAISQGTLSFFFFLKDDYMCDVSSFSWVPIGCLIVFIMTYCFGLGPVGWAFMGEIFPANVKAVATTVTTATSAIFSFILTKHFATATDIIGKSGSFGLFATFCVMAFIFVYTFLPETSGKSLEEIQDILKGKLVKHK